MNDEFSEEPKKPDPTKRVTLRDIAKALNVSHVTVSKALRNQSGASEKLKARIRKKAEEMGYVPDPLLATLSRYRGTSKTKPLQATLAWVNTWPEPDVFKEFNEFMMYLEGARDNAQRLGYRLEEFNTADIPLRRLQTILKTRNIQGILLPPVRTPVEGLNEFDWSSFSVVRYGLSIRNLKTHLVTSAQIVNTMQAFVRAQQLGYKRIGFACEYWSLRLFGTGYFWAQKIMEKDNQLPLLTHNPADDFEQQQSDFKDWLERNRPDALFSDSSATLTFLQNLGYRIPEDIALATTSIHDTPIDTGIDQQPFEIGRAGVRILNSLIAEKSFGLPECCHETLIEGRWVDGSMMPPRN